MASALFSSLSREQTWAIFFCRRKARISFRKQIDLTGGWQDDRSRWA